VRCGAVKRLWYASQQICSLFGKTRIHKVFLDFILNWLVFCATVEITETVTQV
jgi:hypothetical protein